MALPLATVGIASIGEMGAGIAKLLNANNYRVLTNVSDRSESTKQRARAASIELVSSDQKLLEHSDYILSILPPKYAHAAARKIISASRAMEAPLKKPCYYVDLNAISPASASRMAEDFASTAIRFIDGGIIGPAPKIQESGSFTTPSLVVSGPHKLEDAPASGAHFADILNINHIADTIGPASGLKMCFASTTKGLTAIAIQAFTTAHNLGVLRQLQSHLGKFSPKTGELIAKGLVGMPPKAYRWVDEMKEIAETLHDEGGFEKGIFEGVSEVYRIVAEETELGEESTEDTRLGKSAEDVARVMAKGMEKRKLKSE